MMQCQGSIKAPYRKGPSPVNCITLGYELFFCKQVSDSVKALCTLIALHELYVQHMIKVDCGCGNNLQLIYLTLIDFTFDNICLRKD